MITYRQRDLLRFIHSRLMETGVSPSFDEMRHAINLSSKSGIHRLLTGLEERGFIHRFPGRVRAIQVIKLPDAIPHGFSPRVVNGNSGHVILDNSDRFVSIPVRGRIASGTPIEAIQNITFTIMPRDLLPATGECFALEVRGDSMIEAGILDGDIAVIKKSEAADTGDIVVAIIDEEEATLKRFRRRSSSIALEPANISYEVRILPPNRVRIEGKLVSVFRRY